MVENTKKKSFVSGRLMNRMNSMKGVVKENEKEVEQCR
jgi:hypothetical protein